jgi:hypothetical protein
MHGRRENLRRRPELNYSTSVHNRDVLSEITNHRKIVSYKDRSCAVVDAQSANRFQDVSLRTHIKACGWLVQNDDRWP